MKWSGNERTSTITEAGVNDVAAFTAKKFLCLPVGLQQWLLCSRWQLCLYFQSVNYLHVYKHRSVNEFLTYAFLINFDAAM